MSTVPAQIQWTFNYLDKLSGYKLPYEFGGGHPYANKYPPTIILPDGSIGTANGYDCSGWCSAGLWHGGLLHPGETGPIVYQSLDTNAFELWGLPGKGEFMTLWVIDTVDIHHCFLEFNLPSYPSKKISMAPHTGTTCGWLDPSININFLTAGYNARRVDWSKV